nr:TetR-like C-terminal domain-containing protein [Nocardioides thalensis]
MTHSGEKVTRVAGQLRADVDPADAVELVYAPIYYRLLLRTRPVRPEDARRQLQLAFEGLA